MPRAWLADLNLPGSIYGRLPWRAAELTRYEGDRNAWEMEWQFDSNVPFDLLVASISEGLREGDGWEMAEQRMRRTEWTSRWTLTGRDDELWEGEVRLAITDGGVFSLVSGVRRPTPVGRSDGSGRRDAR